PGLGPVWMGRLIQVFLVFDHEQIVRNYVRPSRDRYVAMTSPVPAFQCVPVTPLPIPVARDDDSESILYPGRICNAIPRIQDLLRPYTKDCVGLLTQILCPNVYGYDFETPFFAFEGGSPELIQSAHEATCEQCHRPMRFLFQAGDV